MALLSPSRSSKAASWFTGWISCGGQIVLSASAAFAAALQLQALITLNNPNSYIPQRWQGMLFYWVVLAYSLAVNLWGSKLLPLTNVVSGKSIRLLITSGADDSRCHSHCSVSHNRCRPWDYGAQTRCFLCLYRAFEHKWLVKRRYFLASGAFEHCISVLGVSRPDNSLAVTESSPFALFEQCEWIYANLFQL